MEEIKEDVGQAMNKCKQLAELKQKHSTLLKELVVLSKNSSDPVLLSLVEGCILKYKTMTVVDIQIK